jgi:hypothetical protein
MFQGIISNVSGDIKDIFLFSLCLLLDRPPDRLNKFVYFRACFASSLDQICLNSKQGNV